jgi:hypothetical protein
VNDTLPALRATLTELVALDTTSVRPNAPLIDYAQARLEAAGFSAERQRYTDDAGVEKMNLVAVKGGDEGRAALALVGHSDCVPYDAAWTDALKLTERDGRLYGRGACDTKGFVASALHAATRAERLKGWGVGVGARWQSAVATGYPAFVGSDGTPMPDLAHPFMSGDELNGDTWLSYKRKLSKGRVGWRIQLNIRNAIGSDKPIPVFTNPNGEIALVRVPPQTEWILTNTFRF